MLLLSIICVKLSIVLFVFLRFGDGKIGVLWRNDMFWCQQWDSRYKKPAFNLIEVEKMCTFHIRLLYFLLDGYYERRNLNKIKCKNF